MVTIGDKILKIDNWKDLPENYTGIIESPNGIIYSLNGKIHREDGPAIIWSNGRIEYFVNDKNITEKVNKWLIGKTDIPPYEKWDNNTRLIFKLTFG